MYNLSKTKFLRCLETAEYNAEIALSEGTEEDFYEEPFYYRIVHGIPHVTHLETDIIYDGHHYKKWQLEGQPLAKIFDYPPIEDHLPPPIEPPIESSVEPPVEPPKVTKKYSLAELKREMEIASYAPIKLAMTHNKPECPELEERSFEEREPLSQDLLFGELGKADLELLEEADKISFEHGSFAPPDVQRGSFRFCWDFSRPRTLHEIGHYVMWVTGPQTVEGVDVSGLGGFGIYGLRRYLETGEPNELFSCAPLVEHYRLHSLKK